MLKPIPQENPSRGENKKKLAHKQMHFMRLEMTLRNLEKTDRQLFAHVGKQLMDYIKKAENITMRELNDLIHNLQRTVIGLQKKRIRLMQRQQRKKKGKR